jgi:hypothetical protein
VNTSVEAYTDIEKDIKSPKKEIKKVKRERQLKREKKRDHGGSESASKGHKDRQATLCGNES